MSKSNTRRFINAAWSLLLFQFIASAGAVAITAWAAFQVQPRLTQNPHVQEAAATPSVPVDALPAAPSPPPINTGPGGVRIVGAVAVGQRVAAQFDADPDGLRSAPAYQWLRDGVAIAGATDQAYAPTDADSGRQLAVRADYVDGAGNSESVTSAPVAVPPAIPRCGSSEGLIRVPANVGWCDTGVVIEPGQSYVIRPRGGLWSNVGAPAFGGEGYVGTRYAGTVVENADLGALVGKVGDQQFAIGRGARFATHGQGVLYLSINDVAGTFDDNQGALDVSISAGE